MASSGSTTLRPGELEIAEHAPPANCSQETAQQYTRWLATHHYENFNVVSWLLPRELHQHFYNVYAYCRWADDLGDEIGNAEQATELLGWWRDELHNCYRGSATHPVFVALRSTIERFAIPIDNPESLPGKNRFNDTPPRRVDCVVQIGRRKIRDGAQQVSGRVIGLVAENIHEPAFVGHDLAE